MRDSSLRPTRRSNATIVGTITHATAADARHAARTAPGLATPRIPVQPYSNAPIASGRTRSTFPSARLVPRRRTEHSTATIGPRRNVSRSWANDYSNSLQQNQHPHRGISPRASNPTQRQRATLPPRPAGAHRRHATQAHRSLRCKMLLHALARHPLPQTVKHRQLQALKALSASGTLKHRPAPPNPLQLSQRPPQTRSPVQPRRHTAKGAIPRS